MRISDLKVTKFYTNWVHNGFFMNAELDSTGEYILFQESPKDASEGSPTEVTDKSSDTVTKTESLPKDSKFSASDIAAPMPKELLVICKGCGAQNTVLQGQIGECEYCGSKIQI